MADSPWPTLRAALITAVLFVQLCDGSPLPEKVTYKEFDNPIAAQELKHWVQVLDGWGIETTPKEIKAAVVLWGNRSGRMKSLVIGPIRPLKRWTGTGQAWGVFTYPNTHPHELNIDIEEGGEWRTLHRALDPEHDWRHAHLRYRRMRGVYDDNAWKARRSYDNFVDWVAREAFTELPEATDVKVYFIRRHVTDPGTPKDDEALVRMERTRNRAEMGL